MATTSPSGAVPADMQAILDAQHQANLENAAFQLASTKERNEYESKTYAIRNQKFASG